MTQTIHVLMTGAGAPGAAGIIKCLLQDTAIRLTVADANENAIGKHLHSSFYRIPKANEENFIDEIFSICRKEGISVIMPLVTKELFIFSENKARFETAGIRVMVSSPEAIQVANNKAKCYQFLQEKGIAVPRFFVAHTTEAFMHAAFSLGYPQEAFCFKPCVANGSRGFRVVSDNIDEAEQLFQQKPYKTYITYAHAVKILATQPFPPLVVTEYLPGEEWSVDCLAQKGKAILVVPRLRLKMVHGISVQGRFDNNKEVIDYCTQILEAVGMHGNIGIQVKRSKEGKPLLLEINPRVQGTIVSALGAGVNLPLLAIKQELGLPAKATELQVAWGTSFSRYWTEVFY